MVKSCKKRWISALPHIHAVALPHWMICHDVSSYLFFFHKRLQYNFRNSCNVNYSTILYSSPAWGLLNTWHERLGRSSLTWALVQRSIDRVRKLTTARPLVSAKQAQWVVDFGSISNTVRAITYTNQDGVAI